MEHRLLTGRRKVPRVLCNVDRLRDLMARDAIDAVVGTSYRDVLYLSGFDNALPFETGTGAAAILSAHADRPSSLCLGVPYLAHLVEEPTWMPRVEVYGAIGIVTADVTLPPVEKQVSDALADTADRRNPGRPEAIVAALRACGALKGRVAFADPAVAGLLGDDWQGEAVPGAALLSAGRLIKTPDEIERLRTASQINEAAFARGEQLVAAGADWREVYLGWSEVWAAHGGQGGFWGGGAGAHASQFYPPTARYPVETGDLIRFEGGGTYAGYWADTGRGRVVGQAGSERAEQYANALVAGYEAVREILAPGVPGAAVAAAGLAAIRGSGAPDFPESNVWGHGIGLALNEAPRLRPGAPDVLEPGMVICFETPYFELGWGGLQLEDTYLITESGHELMTEAPRGLEIIG